MLREYRNGRVGVLATLLLLFSLVLFIGSLFWLSVNGPWGGGSLLGDGFFKPASMLKQDEGTSTPIETEEEINLTEAIEDLSESGCVFIEYSGEYSEGDTIRLSYQQFREEAIDRKIVQKAETPQEATVLLVTRNGKIYGWSP